MHLRLAGEAKTVRLAKIANIANTAKRMAVLVEFVRVNFFSYALYLFLTVDFNCFKGILIA